MCIFNLGFRTTSVRRRKAVCEHKIASAEMPTACLVHVRLQNLPSLRTQHVLARCTSPKSQRAQQNFDPGPASSSPAPSATANAKPEPGQLFVTGPNTSTHRICIQVTKDSQIPEQILVLGSGCLASSWSKHWQRKRSCAWPGPSRTAMGCPDE